MGRTLLAAAICMLLLPFSLLAQENSFLNGIDANFSIDMATRGANWDGSQSVPDLLTLLNRNGANALRVRVWTADSGMSSTAYALDIAAKAQAAGLQPYLVLFLSDDWADYVKQPAPAAWQALPLEEKARAAGRYCQMTAQGFADAGLGSDLYAIGNEIDFGICGEFEQDWPNRLNTTYMKQQIWPKAAQIIRAAESGVRKANSKAHFILHLAQWWNPSFAIAFIKVMEEQEVHVDYLGLSFYPTSGLSPKASFADLAANIRQINNATGKRIIISEYAYPSVAQFGGQFASWNKPVAGYPLTDAGQKKWVADFLKFCRSQPSIAGAYYWSPEWYNEEMWQAFSLFDPAGKAKPALASLSAGH